MASQSNRSMYFMVHVHASDPCTQSLSKERGITAKSCPKNRARAVSLVRWLLYCFVLMLSPPQNKHFKHETKTKFKNKADKK